MTLTRLAHVGSVVFFTTLLTLCLFLGNQRLAHADVPVEATDINCEIGQLGDPIPDFDCPPNDGGNGDEDNGPNVPPVDPTECNNGIDDDGDGLSDFVPVFGDPDCDGLFDDSEATSPDDDPGDDDGGGDNGGGDNGGGDPGGGGPGGGPAPACEDSVDNDGDGLIDMNDPGCESAADTDESSPSGGGGSTDSAGGGGGGGGGGSVATTTGEILGTSTTTEALACDTYLTSFLRFGRNNSEEQVLRLQNVLKQYEGATVEENGVFDSATLNAVHAFQIKYADEILKPWGISKSTGYVYLTTRKKVNEIRCENTKTFPLTDAELKKIEDTRTSDVVAVVDAALKPEPAKPKASEKVAPAKKDVKDETPVAEKDDTSAESVRESGLRKVWNFFGRLFNRSR